MIIPDAVWAHEEADTAESLAALYAQIKADASFSDRAPWYPRAVELLGAERFDEAIDLIEAAMPGLFFCPEAHMMAAHAHARIGNQDLARLHTRWAELALDGIRSSGGGTQSSPWRVLRVIDEYAVLRDRGLKPHAQRQVTIEGRRFDVHVVGEGRELWFELV